MEIDEIIKAKFGLSVKDLINVISKENGYGSITNNYQQVLRGLNHRGLGNPLAKVNENVGITLATRPYLNLTTDNIRLNRLLSNLITSNNKTIQYYIRAILDPRSNLGIQVPERLDTPLINPHNPFIPIFTNTLLTTSGWPDIAVGTNTTSEGIMKETMTTLDGIHTIPGQWSLTCNFSNIEGDPITGLFFYWLVYGSSIKIDDNVVPYPNSIVNNRVDYNTGIYHLVLSPTKRKVTKIAKTIALPTTCSIGSDFNLQNNQERINAKDQVSVQFACNGAEYMDPILYTEFNNLLARYDSRMIITEVDFKGKIKIRGEDSLIKLRADEFKSANYYGRPLIHPITQDLLWYVDSFEYNELSRRF